MLIHALIASRDPLERERLTRLLESSEVEILAVTRPGELWARLQRGDLDLLLLDPDFMPDPAREWILSLRRLPERPEVIVIVDREAPRERASLLAAGALAVLNRQLPDGIFGEILQAMLKRMQNEAQIRLDRSDRAQESSLDDFVSASIAMQQFMEVARKVLPSDSSVLILGETGSGKERLAQAIHKQGLRADKSFLAINCGALPESLLESELFGHELGAFTGATRTRRGYFELAHKGTLFLDEIGEMPLHLQVKLLRVLEDRRIYRVGGEHPIPVDVRIMAASNRNLGEEVEEKRFRADLFFRLAVVTLNIPPLRERREDVPQLVENYLDYFNAQLGRSIEGLEPEALESLILYDWPGNVRELINVMERAVLLCATDKVGLDVLPDAIRGSRTPAPMAESAGESMLELPADVEWTRRPFKELRDELVAAFEAKYLSALLRETGGRVALTARRAELSERAVYNLMKRHGLRKESFKRVR